MNTTYFLEQLRKITTDADQERDFTRFCYLQGLCSVDEAKQAIKKIHEKTLKEIQVLQDEHENMYQGQSFI